MSMRRALQILGIASFCAFIGIEAWCNRGLVTKAFSAENQSWRKFVQAVRMNSQQGFFGKVDWIDGNGLFMRALDRRVSNTVLRGKGDMLLYREWGRVDPLVRAKEICRWNRWQAAHGGKYLYVQTPAKLDRRMEILPAGCNPDDFGVYRLVDNLIAVLRTNNVPCMDLSWDLVMNAKQVQCNYYRTDHHWTYEAAFSVFPGVARKIAELAGTTLPLDCPELKSENWKRITLPRSFLGSHGRRTGAGFAGYDDFTYLVPIFPTRMAMCMENGDLANAGDFGEAIVSKRVLASGAFHDAAGVRYGVYFGSERGAMHIRSALAPCKARICIVKDSYALPMLGFLSTVFSEILVVDPRYGRKAIGPYVRDWRPDVLVTFVNPRATVEKCFFNCDLRESLQTAVPNAAASSVKRAKLSVRPSKRQWNYAIMTLSLKPGLRYRLSVGKTTFKGSGHPGFGVVALCGKGMKKPDRLVIAGSGRTEWNFEIPLQMNEPRLLFYSGMPGNCAGYGAEYADIELVECVERKEQP